MYGDIPFFISHDSADVWACPERFHLNQKDYLLMFPVYPQTISQKLAKDGDSTLQLADSQRRRIQMVEKSNESNVSTF